MVAIALVIDAKIDLGDVRRKVATREGRYGTYLLHVLLGRYPLKVTTGPELPGVDG